MSCSKGSDFGGHFRNSRSGTGLCTLFRQPSWKVLVFSEDNSFGCTQNTFKLFLIYCSFPPVQWTTEPVRGQCVPMVQQLPVCQYWPWPNKVFVYFTIYFLLIGVSVQSMTNPGSHWAISRYSWNVCLAGGDPAGALPVHRWAGGRCGSAGWAEEPGPGPGGARPPTPDSWPRATADRQPTQDPLPSS